MRVPPFFRLSPPHTEPASPEPVRHLYHDNDACPLGQAAKRSEQWQYYEPKQVADTRIRCAICIEMSRLF